MFAMAGISSHNASMNRNLDMALIRTFITVAAAARGRGEIFHMKAIPIFAVTCTAATMSVE